MPERNRRGRQRVSVSVADASPHHLLHKPGALANRYTYLLYMYCVCIKYVYVTCIAERGTSESDGGDAMAVANNGLHHLLHKPGEEPWPTCTHTIDILGVYRYTICSRERYGRGRRRRRNRGVNRCVCVCMYLYTCTHVGI